MCPQQIWRRALVCVSLCVRVCACAHECGRTFGLDGRLVHKDIVAFSAAVGCNESKTLLDVEPFDSAEHAVAATCRCSCGFGHDENLSKRFLHTEQTRQESPASCEQVRRQTGAVALVRAARLITTSGVHRSASQYAEGSRRRNQNMGRSYV